MKEYQGHLYETPEDWHPVVISEPVDFFDKIVYLPSWLQKYCPEAWEDYDAWVYHEDNLLDAGHRSIYFFRDHEVAVLFALRWS